MNYDPNNILNSEETNFVKLSVYQSLEAENARLKAEVERLTELNSTLALRYDATNSMLDGCAKEIEEMEAEVEELKLENSQYEEHHKYGQNVITSLREEVERLTKAGDAMMDWIDHQHDDSGYPHSESWEAAKEGKQP